MHPVIYDFGSISVFGQPVPIVIGSYGLMFLIGILTGWLMVLRLGRSIYPDAPWTDIYFGSAIAGFVGAKLTNVIVFLPSILAGKRSFFGAMMGGGVWLGGAIAGVTVCGIIIMRHGMQPGLVANVVFTAMPLAHGIGRIGCLLGGCCFGSECSLPWAITYTSQLAHRLNGTPLNVPLHPSPVYEFIAEMFNFAVCYTLWRRKARPWMICVAWTGLYGAERFALEFLRSDPRGEYGLLTTSQWISLGMLAAAAAALYGLRRTRTA